MVNIADLVRDQTPVVALVALLDGTLRQRVGIVTSYDGLTLRMYDLVRAPDGTVKGHRSTPESHVIRLEPLPEGSPQHRLVRRSIAAAYTKGPQ